LRSFKNRFGATDELGIFVMEGAGMMEAPNAGRAFVDEATLGVPGNVLTITGEGSRPIALEVQALVTSSNLGGNSRRSATGFDINRLHMILAVLEKRCGIPFGAYDVYLNIVGGIKLTEPAGDLAVALALVSSIQDKTLLEGTFAVGEVGLGGEVRRVRQLERRLNEAVALRLTIAIAPGVKLGRSDKEIHYSPVATIQDAIKLLMPVR
jgi:DNA repair protein RadA/Sms